MWTQDKEKIVMEIPSTSRGNTQHALTRRRLLPVAVLVSALSLTLLLIVVASAGGAQAASGPVPPSLGAAQSFAVLAGSTVTNTGPTAVNGNLGVSPGSACTGFPAPCTGGPGTVTGGAIHAGDTTAANAQAALTTAYNAAKAAGPATTVNTELGGTTLIPGVYNSAGGTFQITGTLTLNGQTDPNATWIFQTASTLVTASSSTVALINGAQACHVFWQIGSSATIGTNSNFVGNTLALTSISVLSGVTVNGRVLARNGAVTLDSDRITAASCSTATPTSTTGTGGGGTPTPTSGTGGAGTPTPTTGSGGGGTPTPTTGSGGGTGTPTPTTGTGGGTGTPTPTIVAGTPTPTSGTGGGGGTGGSGSGSGTGGSGTGSGTGGSGSGSGTGGSGSGTGTGTGIVGRGGMDPVQSTDPASQTAPYGGTDGSVGGAVNP